MAAQKRNHSTDVGKCVCDKCGVEAHGVLNRPHRKCKDKKNRGKWQKAG